MLKDCQKLTSIACCYCSAHQFLRAIWSRQEPRSHQGQVEQKLGNLAFEQAKLPISLTCQSKRQESSAWGGNPDTRACREQGIHFNASVNSSSAHSPPGNRGAFAQVVSPGDGASAILTRPGGWAFAYPGATPGHSTHVFWKVPWMSSSGKTRRLSNNGLSVRY